MKPIPKMSTLFFPVPQEFRNSFHCPGMISNEHQIAGVEDGTIRYSVSVPPDKIDFLQSFGCHMLNTPVLHFTVATQGHWIPEATFLLVLVSFIHLPAVSRPTGVQHHPLKDIPIVAVK